MAVTSLQDFVHQVSPFRYYSPGGSRPIFWRDKKLFLKRSSIYPNRRTMRVCYVPPTLTTRQISNLFGGNRYYRGLQDTFAPEANSNAARALRHLRRIL